MHFLSPNNGESGRIFTRICSLEFVKEKRIKSASNEDTLGSVDAQIKSGTRPFLAWVDRLVLTRRIKNMLLAISGEGAGIILVDVNQLSRVSSATQPHDFLFTFFFNWCSKG